MFRRLAHLTFMLLAVVGALCIVAALFLLKEGIGARTEPGTIETTVARRARSLAIPAVARARVNPELQNAETLRSGMEHFADHCASCHANDGSGDTAMGRGLYPRAPDMRMPATQELTDGELFYIIEQGVKLTGMPAWGTGTPGGEAASWHLVQFIRHLPKLTEEEEEAMKELNPRSAAEWREEEEMRRFLAGEEPAPVPTFTHGHGGPR